MLEPRSRSQFRKNPEDGFISGENWFYFAFDLTLFGYAIWGRPAPDDIRALVGLLEIELDRPVHAALVDLSLLEAVIPEAFEALASYTVKNEDALKRIISHTAIVRPTGVSGAVVSGFFDVTVQPFPISLWTKLEPALVHLGRKDAADCVAAIAAVRSQISRQPALLTTLHAYLAMDLLAPSVERAAHECGLSSRTLQRRLAENRTSFGAEVQSARIRAAERFLEEADTPVTTIAFDLGFATPQHFSTVFRKQTGYSPTAFRARRLRK